MKITRELLDKIAHLARLEVREDEAEKMMQDLTEILNWVDKLKEVDTEGVEPLTTMSYELNALREDDPNKADHEKHLDRERALLNAPQKNGEYFIVPKVLE